jgi:hypothetical protein
MMSALLNCSPPLTLHSSANMNIHNVNTTNCTNDFFRAHIQHAHLTGIWTWQYMHDTRWRALFYKYLKREAANSAPLTASEIHEYNTLLNTQLPSEGFFPTPHIAIRSLALTHMHVRVQDPLPISQQRHSRLCVPSERYATSRTRHPVGTRLGYYTGWIINTPPPNTTYIYRLQPSAQGAYCDIQGWDDQCTLTADIFPLSHINEYIWNEVEANPNNLRGTNTGEIITRKVATLGEELTLGLAWPL